MSQTSSKSMWTPVAELGNDRTDLLFKLRAIRVYFVPVWTKGGDSMEVVFHDKDGTRIHAHIKKPEKKRFESQIVENGVYGIRDVFIHDNFQSCKTTANQKLLVFYAKTQVKTLDGSDFPRFMFDLRSFATIQNQPILNDQVLIDVIGKIVGRSRVQTKNIRTNGEQKLMEIMLEDHEGNRLGCTLWGEYVDRFLGCLTQDVQEPVILLLSFCKPKRYMGTVTVSTSFHVTNMIFDGNSAEVNAFRARLPLHVDDGGPMAGLMLAGGDDDQGVMSITTIRNLLDTTKPGPYCIIGEIAFLENVSDWCYLGCTDCNKKVIPDGDSFTSSGCGKSIPQGVYKYKVNVRVFDSTGHASFILWDRECNDLLGASAFLLREIMLEKNMDPNLLPVELNRLLGKKCLFNVLLKAEVGSPHWTGPRTIGVRSLVTDPKILKKYEHVVLVEEKEVDDESEGWWNSLEDLSQKVKEVVGSSEPSSSQSVNTRARTIDVDDKDSVRRDLSDELEGQSSKKAKTIHEGV